MNKHGMLGIPDISNTYVYVLDKVKTLLWSILCQKRSLNLTASSMVNITKGNVTGELKYFAKETTH